MLALTDRQLMRLMHTSFTRSSCRGKIFSAILFVMTVTNNAAQANKDGEQLMLAS